MRSDNDYWTDWKIYWSEDKIYVQNPEASLDMSCTWNVTVTPSFDVCQVIETTVYSFCYLFFWNLPIVTNSLSVLKCLEYFIIV